MVEANIDNVAVNVNFTGSIFDSVRQWFDGITTTLRSGDDESLTALMSSVVFIVAGIFVFRRL